ncbi:MAG: carbohydrate ABC transporter permease, partial [Acutalibacteraceae bacterium]
MNKIRKNSLQGRTNRAGWLFCLPFLIGFLFFYLQPIIQTVRFSFSDVELDIGGYNVIYKGLDNYAYAFRGDQTYTANFIKTLTSLAYRVPVIVISSLFFAVLLNREFVGKTFMRAVFFLPVIVASGVVISILKNDVVSGTMLSGNAASLSDSGGSIMGSSGLEQLLTNSGMNSKMVGFFTNISNNLFDLMWQTGIQMIIFLAGLQTISPALYEAADTEGASAWEKFWMITLPMLVPMLLINVV